MSRLKRVTYEEMDEREDRWQDEAQERRDRLAEREPDTRCVECGYALEEEARCSHCGRHS